MSSQRSRAHVTHETMAKVLLSQRKDIGAARQAQGREKYFGEDTGVRVDSSAATVSVTNSSVAMVSNGYGGRVR